MNPSMWSDATLLAVILVVGIFVLLLATLFRFKDVDHVAKAWTAISTLTAFVFGSIGTFYFTKEAHRGEVRALQSQASNLISSTHFQQSNAIALRMQLTNMFASSFEPELRKLRAEIAGLRAGKAETDLIGFQDEIIYRSTTNYLLDPLLWGSERDPYSAALKIWGANELTNTVGNGGLKF